MSNPKAVTLQTIQPSATLSLKVVPNSAQSAIVGWLGDALKVKVAAIPENGKANKAVVALLAKALHLPSKQVSVVSGTTAAHKIIHIQGLDTAAVYQKIESLLSNTSSPSPF